jgi:hypothetical protein
VLPETLSLSNHTFTLVLNAGRSGSSFLTWLLEANYPGQRLVLHEGIPVQVSKPRVHNRAYDPAALQAVLNDPDLAPVLSDWQKKLATTDIIETGWTACHLAPVLHHLLGERLRLVILHRDPVSFAFSRANMGNYHPHTFYDNAHEVSPSDPRSIAPEFLDRWPAMNSFEKCLFWWFVVYRESFEFHEKNPSVPCLVLNAADLFSFRRAPELLCFLGLEEARLLRRDVPKNELPRFTKETFPVRDEWRVWTRHPEILSFAESLGHRFNPADIEKQAAKYRLPSGLGPRLRHAAGYWRWKRRLKSLLG